MDTIKVFKETRELDEKTRELEEALDRLNIRRLEIMEECPHEIVFKYDDNFPGKVVVDGNYFCPSCGMIINCSDKEDINYSIFKDSRIIPLTKLPLLGSSIIHDAIREEVSSNMDFYYDYIIPTEELSLKMEEVLKDKQVQFINPEKVLNKQYEIKR